MTENPFLSENLNHPVVSEKDKLLSKEDRILYYDNNGG